MLKDNGEVKFNTHEMKKVFKKTKMDSSICIYVKPYLFIWSFLEERTEFARLTIPREAQ